MSKHTPGPWSVKFRNDHSAYISLGDSRVGPHKQFDIEFDDRDPSDVADARLIAAAPELLESAKELATHVREMCRVLCIPEPAASLERYEAAIAKATGEQQ